MAEQRAKILTFFVFILAANYISKKCPFLRKMPCIYRARISIGAGLGSQQVLISFFFKLDKKSENQASSLGTDPNLRKRNELAPFNRQA
jgi:hypothetical protein